MKNKTWFYRQLLAYIPPFFTVITFIFFIFFHTLSEQSRKEAVKANETLLVQAMGSIDSSLKTIEESLITELLKNEDLSAFYNGGKQDDYYLNIRVVNFMRDFMASHPIVDSIYLVRNRDEFVLSNSMNNSLREYMDYSFIEPYLNQAGTRWTGSRSFQEFEIIEPRQVATLVLKAPFVRNGEGFFVVNVSPGKMKRLVDNMFSANISFLRVLDSRNHNIFSVYDDGTEKEKVVSHVSSPLTGWKYESGLVHGTLANLAYQLHSTWFFIGFLMVVAGVLWMVFVTKRSYKPIEQIVSQIQKFSQTKASALLKKNRQDEFAFIESALNDMLAQSNSFQQRYREDLHLKKAYLFQQLLDGQYPQSLTQWESQREMMQLNDLDKRQVVCAVEIDDYGQFLSKYTHQDQYLLKFAIKSVIQETAQKCGGNLWAEWIFSSKLGILLQIEDGQDPERVEMNILENARAWIEQNLKLTITIGVGEPVKGHALIPESYAHALHALKYKMTLGDNKVIFYSRMVREEHEKSFDYFQLVHSMAQSFRLSREDWRNQYDTVMRSIGQDVWNRDNVLSIADYMIYSIGREMGLMPKEFQELWTGVGQQSLEEALRSSETLDRLDSRFKEALGKLFERMRHLQEQRGSSDKIREIREYMEREYRNPDLSLDYLSDRFHINSKSLSKLFKEETGQKFVDYLIELRIRSSQKLLERTNRPIAEIAEEVGYTNVISFGRMFKKIVNLSPGEYREHAGK
ncbi:helix-turn-helix domain-containing protein [Paenibacillus arenilitoris]|uniref:Helix-turn-helix domain-containing protein n=1 Tax=Paenibacillus arenilitoris TaxID=2772299 RepID=A0A927CPS5_9BACL|nr:helix-turn-helix domain-containing protein [Paenibacillus arenilitoris]MBD2870847.1 helix-turn-helix domain-containing protein [Paenibacillus arenilitoris]